MSDPVYTSMDLERIVEYKTIFPRSAMPSVKDCIRGFDREHLFGGLVANMANKVVRRPFFNPSYHGNESEIDTLRFFLSKVNNELLVKSIAAIEKTARREGYPLENYVGGSEESILYLVREIMAQDIPEEPMPQEVSERDFYKALLASNTHTLAKGRGKIPFSRKQTEMYFASVFLQQFGSADFLYHDRRLLMLTQTIKCIRFFEFAEKDAFMSPFIKDFCKKYEIKEWWMYPKALWSVYAVTGGVASIINVSNLLRFKDGEQFVSVIDNSSISSQKVIEKKNNVDYVAFRERPLIKIAENEYVVFNFQLLIERIYSGLYFDFRDIASKRGVGRGFFKQYYTTNFSEKSLLCGILREAMHEGYDVVLDENDCLTRDKSKDADNVSKPDFYARKGKTVFVFENKDILFAGKTKEMGTLQEYIDFIKTRLYQNEEGGPEGVLQLMNTVNKIRTGEFQRRWDSECPSDAVVYPILVVPEAKFTVLGVKSYLQFWQNRCGISMNNVMPVALVDIGTLCLYQHVINSKGLQTLLDDYYNQSDIIHFEDSKDLNDIPNALMSFTDLLVHTDNDTLQKFAGEWENYIRKGED